MNSADIPLQFRGLTHLVQYRRKDGYDPWHNMAAFDVESVATKYRDDCAGENRPWEYQVIPVTPTEDE